MTNHTIARTSDKDPSPSSFSFKDAYGATVTIASGDAARYASVKAEQLKFITQLLTEVAVGSCDLPDDTAKHFQVVANGMAHELETLIDVIANDAAQKKVLQ
jgi:hypothetical protein